jgi:fatty-acyl-CoA synthase
MQRLLSSLYERVKDLPERGYLVGKLAKESGMVWDLAPRGTLEAVRALASGAQNPSLVYRLHGANVPDRLAVVQREVAWTFRELDERIDRVAKGLVRRGLGRGKSVLLMLKNRPEMVLLSAACARIGAPAVAISWRSKPDELVYLANHSGARALVTEEELYPVVEEASKGFTHVPLLDALFVVGKASGRAKSFDDLYERAGRFQPVRGSEDDAAVVVYTSGTTGKPKGAVRKFPKAAMPAAVRFSWRRRCARPTFTSSRARCTTRPRTAS